MTNEKFSDGKNYDDLKSVIMRIVSETPNDMSLGVKMRLFASSLKDDLILKPEQLEGKTI